MRLLPLLLLMTLLTACGGGSAVAPVGNYGTSYRHSYHPKSAPSYYKVRKGDTLYSISWRYGWDYKDLARVNGISRPYTIYVGQIIHFSKQRTTTTRSSRNYHPAPKTASRASRTHTRSSEDYSSNQRLQWHWPTQGKVVATYSSSSPANKGINIAGKPGQPVMAAASGKVVYSGNGLPRYGNLLIIKHNDVYLSAYAHNKVLLVGEGQHVKAGQKIATLGSSGTQSDQLHFEIRRNGKPVDPLRFLPKNQ